MTHPNLLTTDEKADLEDAEELQAHRDGVGHLAEDPMHAGQPVHMEIRYQDGEPIYRLQVTHAGVPLWQCDQCRKLTLTADPSACVGCGVNAIEAFGPLLYPAPVECRTVASAGTTPYGELCLIAGSDYCDCGEGEN